MAEITIGDIRLNSDGNTLTITLCDQPDMTISFDSNGFEQLLDFVTFLAGSEFNRRQTFRVPLWETSGLSVQIVKDKTQRSGTPKDISLTGLFVELDPDDSLNLAQDDDVEVILELDGEVQSHHGVVLRCTDNGYGIFFRDSMKSEQIDPPPELTRIVMELQRRWMGRRADSVQ